MRMAVVRDIEPWDALLEAGREDERLVMQAAQNRRPARAVALPAELHPEVADALRARGVERLWSHQAEALHAAWAGPTIVTTGTASGKSLCFQLPTLDTLCRDAARARSTSTRPRRSRRTRRARCTALGVARARPAIYDGDTPREQRAQIRRRAERDPHQPRHAAPRDPAQPPRPGRTCSRTSRSSWSTRRTSTAACSARTSRTCCAGCGGSRPPTGPSRASCSRARRSPTRASSPSG